MSTVSSGSTQPHTPLTDDELIVQLLARRVSENVSGHPFITRAVADPLCEQAAKRLYELRERKDGAYEERNKVVAALARLFPSGVARTTIPGWSDDWHGCVYIDLPTGQVSWHFHDSQAHLFEGLPAYAGEWDGHDTPEKYRRLAELGK